MDIQEFYMRRIYSAFKLAGFRFDREGNVTAKAGPLEALPDIVDAPDIVIPQSAYPEDITPDPDAAEEIRAFSRAGHLPAVIFESSRIFYMGFEDDSGDLYFLGPASLGILSQGEVHAYYHRRGCAGSSIPSVTLQQALSCLSMLYAADTGKTVSEKEIIAYSLPNMYRQMNQPENDRKQAAWYMDMFNKNMMFSTYQDERNFLDEFRQGEMWIPDEVIIENLWQLESVGPLSRDNFYKLSEYAVVTAAALLRAEAIDAGVPWEKAYKIFNDATQSLAGASTALETMFVYRDVVNALSAQIRGTREKVPAGSLSEQCKRYITQNIRKNFTIQEMADEMGYSTGYLSRVFSEAEGVTLQQYIMREKLSRAAELLIHSDEKIGTISDYLGFHSQSYMAEQFSRHYSMTPSQYRKKYKVSPANKSAQYQTSKKSRRKTTEDGGP